MSLFYSSIAPFYDDIFPAGNAQKELLKDLAGDRPADVLDLATATGAYAIFLSELGHRVTAVDLDHGMLDIMRKTPSNVKIIEDDMRMVSEYRSSFDLIYCIGNSLVHLSNQEQMERFIKDAYRALRSDGQFLVQIVNFDCSPTVLPTIHNTDAGITFHRQYHETPDGLDFHTKLITQDDSIENHEQLTPILSDQLVEFFEEAGFKAIQTFGDFKGTSYDPLTSFSLVILGVK